MIRKFVDPHQLHSVPERPLIIGLESGKAQTWIESRRPAHAVDPAQGVLCKFFGRAFGCSPGRMPSKLVSESFISIIKVAQDSIVPTFLESSRTFTIRR